MGYPVQTNKPIVASFTNKINVGSRCLGLLELSKAAKNKLFGQTFQV